MIELRWTTLEGATTKEPRLQYRMLFYPVLIAGGVVVLRLCKEGEVEAVWMDVPLVVVPSNASLEGPGAASSRTVPLDAVVGPQGDRE